MSVIRRVSKILDEFGRPFVREIATERLSAYDLAKTTSENRRHWRMADDLSARAANSPEVRRTLRNRSRSECDNDPYYHGLARDFSKDLFGTGPRLQCQLIDEDALNLSIEQKFGSWCNAIGLVSDLLVAGISKIIVGEPFAIIRTAEVKGEPVPLTVQWLEADHCTTPLNSVPKDQSRWVDGIELDDLGKPRYYHFLKRHPGDADVYDQEFEKVPADLVLHWFHRSRIGQYRGVPECTSSISTGAQRRRWNQATLTAAELAADFAVLITSDLPPGYEEDDLPSPFETLNINRGMITTLPAGGDAKQMRSEHPGAEYTPFKHEQLKEMGRPIGAPYSITGLDGSEHNYSSLRYERELYNSTLTVERNGCRTAILDRIFQAWYAIARIIPGYLADTSTDLPELVPFAWYWPGFAAIDPLKEAAADTERLTNGTTTLQEIYASYGQDYIAALTQRARELTLMKQLGLPLPAWAGAAPMPAPASDKQQRFDDQQAKLRLALLTTEAS